MGFRGRRRRAQASAQDRRRHHEVTAVKVVDANPATPISVTPGIPFWVEIDWQYNNEIARITR